ncbi:hypothetical protein [Cupriavidus sp. D39]|uniref:hypothetical protein n=1 Tax=Cupriavidus sp. D39 TaxID=2997877 RepID=UPI00226FD869|nr:hypothetical protein [Cupriavidus sp. D39]MCY0854308.1 hypothetical protein [Cupriavidus sp. D39]
MDNFEKGAIAAAPFDDGKGATGDTKGCNLEQERVQSEAIKGATAIAPNPSLPVLDPSVTRSASAPPDHIRNSTTGEINPRPVQISILLRKTYSLPVTSNSAEVLELSRLAVTDLEIAEHIDAFRIKKPGEQPNARYVLRMIESTRKALADAAADADPAVSGPAAAEAGIWWRSASGINAKGLDLGIKQKPNEPEWVFKTRVFRDAGPGKWRDEWETKLQKEKAQSMPRSSSSSTATRRSETRHELQTGNSRLHRSAGRLVEKDAGRQGCRGHVAARAIPGS